MPKAYSYLRFSTPEQMQGDSQRRQLEQAEQYAAKEGLELDKELSFSDPGVSAFRGANAETGDLAAFRGAIKAGLVEPGSYLLVESLDRLSRNKARKAVRILEDICEAGVAVVTLSDGKVYTEEALDDDPMAFMWAIMVAMRAHEESAMKSRRLKAAWADKRAKAKEKPLTKLAPAWLRWNGEQWEVDEERAAVVRRIFGMALEGMGQHRIAETLNAEGVPTFANHNGRQAHFWQRSYVRKLLENPAVEGSLVPHSLDYSSGKRQRTAHEPVPGYFPAVVDKETVARVRAMQESGAPKVRNGSGKVSNVLAGVARCPSCGGTMTRVNKGPKGGRPYLACTKAKAKGGCDQKAVRLEGVEEALRLHGPQIVHEAPLGDPGLDQAIAEAAGTLDFLDEQIANLVEALAAGPSEALRKELDKAEQAAEEWRKERDRLHRQAMEQASPVLEKKLADLDEALAADVWAPDRVNALLRQLASKVVVDTANGRLDIHWQHGGESEVVFAFPEPA